MESTDPEVVRKPPRSKDEPIVTKQLVQRVLTSSVLVLLVTLWVYIDHLEGREVNTRGRTMVMIGLIYWSS